jgi:hypothetical protein
LKLQEIYAKRCVVAVVCVSERYGNKPWTQAEHSAIRARVMQARTATDEREKLGVLPIRVGNGEVKGILFNTIAPDVRERAPERTAELIVERLRLMGVVTVASSPVSLPPRPDHPIYVPPGGPDRVGLHQELVRIFPRSRNIEARAAELSVTEFPETDDPNVLWNDVLRQLGNRRADIRGLLNWALQAEPMNKLLLQMYR